MRRQWLRNWKTLTVVAVIFLAAGALVAYWERSGYCVRWATRVDASRGGSFLTWALMRMRYTVLPWTEIVPPHPDDDRAEAPRGVEPGADDLDLRLGAPYPHRSERGVEEGAATVDTQLNASSGRASSTQITSWHAAHSSPRRITRGMKTSPTTPPVSSSTCLAGWSAWRSRQRATSLEGIIDEVAVSTESSRAPA